MTLNGNWLAEAGFSTDTPVTVSVEPGRLVIDPVTG
ncbi:SymE family type I addiction module toxin [Leclercia adecarboxylata]